MPQGYSGASAELSEMLLFPGPLGPGFLAHFSMLSTVDRQQGGSLSSNNILVIRKCNPGECDRSRTSSTNGFSVVAPFVCVSTLLAVTTQHWSVVKC